MHHKPAGQTLTIPNHRDLASMDRLTLMPVWIVLNGSPPPRGMSTVLMRRILAFDIQAKRGGGITKTLLRDLNRLAGTGDAKRRRPARGVEPGGRLIREWNGVTHIVDVIDTGFVWNGQSYQSLSPIARAITGSHWSGPRFFGLIKSEKKALRP